MTAGLPDDAMSSVELKDGVVYVHWRPGALINQTAAKAAVARSKEICAGKALPALVEFDGLKGMDHGAGDILAKEWPFKQTAIVGSSPVDEVILAFYTARHRPAYPRRFFLSVSDALAWLAESASKPKS